MATAKDLRHSVKMGLMTGDLSEGSTGVAMGELIRDYVPKEGVKWRWGKPDYSRVNKTYFQHRTKIHAEGSLEAVVSKIVKNWEVDTHHVEKIEDWQTVHVPTFKISVNNGPKADAQVMADIGPYNALIGEHAVYKASQHTFESANSLFSDVFPEGFAWECLEVYSGPPVVNFKWRHFGKFGGSFKDHTGKEYMGTGEMIEVFGLCIAKVNECLKVEELEIYYDPSHQLMPLMKCPITSKAAQQGGFSCCQTPQTSKDVQG